MPCSVTRCLHCRERIGRTVVESVRKVENFALGPCNVVQRYCSPACWRLAQGIVPYDTSRDRIARVNESIPYVFRVSYNCDAERRWFERMYSRIDGGCYYTPYAEGV